VYLADDTQPADAAPKDPEGHALPTSSHSWHAGCKQDSQDSGPKRNCKPNPFSFLNAGSAS